jgi:hypothetical protein
MPKSTEVFYVKLKSNNKIVFESGSESRARLNCDFENEYISAKKEFNDFS